MKRKAERTDGTHIVVCKGVFGLVSRKNATESECLMWYVWKILLSGRREMINSREPNIEPWGTPEASGNGCDLKFERSDFNRFRGASDGLRSVRPVMRMLWDTAEVREDEDNVQILFRKYGWVLRVEDRNGVWSTFMVEISQGVTCSSGQMSRCGNWKTAF